MLNIDAEKEQGVCIKDPNGTDTHCPCWWDETGECCYCEYMGDTSIWTTIIRTMETFPYEPPARQAL